MDKTRRDKVRDRLLGLLPKQSVGAEIGVWEGAFSRRILAIVEPRELHLIDPWAYQPEFPGTGFGRPRNAGRMEAIHAGVVAALGADPRVRIHRATSEVALAALPDASLDWVYIDGNHNEPFIGRDLDLALAKVRPNGIIAGDDLNWNEAGGAPVRRAVERLAATLGAGARLRVMANQYLIDLGRD